MLTGASCICPLFCAASIRCARIDEAAAAAARLAPFSSAASIILACLFFAARAAPPSPPAPPPPFATPSREPVRACGISVARCTRGTFLRGSTAGGSGRTGAAATAAARPDPGRLPPVLPNGLPLGRRAGPLSRVLAAGSAASQPPARLLTAPPLAGPQLTPIGMQCAAAAFVALAAAMTAAGWRTSYLLSGCGWTPLFLAAVVLNDAIWLTRSPL